jgi:hypothetical protein
MPAAAGINNLVIHVGLPKTGTTFLQNHVFSSCDQIADFGKTPSYRGDRPQVYEALKIVASASDAEFRTHVSDVRALLLREAQEAGTRKPSSSCRLLSYEGFYHPNSLHPLGIHDRLVSILGDFKVLVTIRQQFSWIASYYLYRFYRFLHGGGPSFEVWAKRSRKRPGWNAFVCCDYWRVVEQLINRVGRDRVLVMPMEEVVQSHSDSGLRRLAGFLDVDFGVLAASFAQAPPTKERIDELGFLLGRVLYEAKKSDLSSDELLQMKRAFRSIHDRRHQSYRKANVPLDIIEGSFSDDERETMQTGNTALSRVFDQDLGRFGYPVVEPS